MLRKVTSLFWVVGKKEHSLETWAYDRSDTCTFNALNEIRRINNKWFKGEEPTNQDKARYYSAKAELMSTFADFADDLEEVFYFLDKSRKYLEIGREFIEF